MFFEFSKIAAFLVSPVHMLAALGFALTFWPHMVKRSGPFRVIQLLLGMLLCMLILPIGNALLVPLETRFPAPTELPDHVDGIIVLGGAVDEVVNRTVDEAVYDAVDDAVYVAVGDATLRSERSAGAVAALGEVLG